MARQQSAAEIKAFVKGLITEASPLTFPDNASIDELNLILNKDGSRKRRLGMEYESGYTEFSTGLTTEDYFYSTSFEWRNPGGFADLWFIVVQLGKSLLIFDGSSSPISSHLLGSYNIGSDATSPMSMTSIDGIMTVVTGSGDVYAFEYDGSTLTYSTNRLLIRDLFGVEDIIGGVNLREGVGISVRPSSTTDAHIYNLRNQTFAYPRYENHSESITDCIHAFNYSAEYTLGQGHIYPSNSDSVVPFVYADANDSDDRNSKRYFSVDAVVNPLGNQIAPMGAFIIDALNRGAGRLSAVHGLDSANSQNIYHVSSLPTDSTPGGATCVGGFAGRVFYGGFSAKVVDGDSQSPRLGSYLLFSRLIQSAADVYKCYQEGDPTSTETPDLVDTDGGFLRIEGAANIMGLVNAGDSLIVLAENGVWRVSGGAGYGFKSTDYLVSKITEHGVISRGSIVVVDNTVMYWAVDGIYHVSKNQYGDWESNNLSNTTIQSYFDDIPSTAKKRVTSLYDSYSRKVRWLYNNFFGADGDTMELILDANLSAFYPSKIKKTSSNYPLLVCPVRTPAFSISTGTVNVINSSGNYIITSGNNRIVTNSESVDSSVSEIVYLTITKNQSGLLYGTFSYYSNNSFLDWYSSDNTGIDASAYLLTGWISGGDFQRMKQVPLVTIYSVKTETGFDTNYNPVNPSSIIVQGQWNWANLASSNKWTSSFQAYRHTRLWIPSSASSGFDDGNHVVVTRNRLRGRGRVLSMLFSTEAGKDFHLLGWSMVVSTNGNV